MLFERMFDLSRMIADKIKALDNFIKSQQLLLNVEEARKLRYMTRLEKYGWMIKNFTSGGKYDVKNGNSAMEHAGNFNYGAMGRAIGFSELELKGGAGVQQFFDGTSDLSFVTSYGDDPEDQKYIQAGIDWYYENFL